MCTFYIITSISPSEVAGGIGEIVTIKGECFGDNYIDGISKVEFSDARPADSSEVWVNPLRGEYIVDCGLASIYCWTDTMIQVKVPSVSLLQDNTVSRIIYAGSGNIRVCNDENMCFESFSSDIITVKYSLTNSSTTSSQTPSSSALPVALRNANNLGGMSLTYHPNFLADNDAINVFERALRTWKCATRVNFNTDQSTSNTLASDSIVIRYGTTPSGSLTALAVTIKKLDECTDLTSGAFLKADVKDFKIIVRDTSYWHKQEDITGLDTNEYDMETVILHELGHAHLFNHVNQGSDVMYHNIAKGSSKRTLGPHNIEGGEKVMDISAINYGNSDCGNAMIPVDTTGLNCYLLNSIPDINNELGKLHLFPNPVSSVLNYHLESDARETIRVRVYDMFGRVVYEEERNKSNRTLKGQFDISTFPKGVYIFNMSFSNSDSFSKQFIKS